ncbi:unnamed protein product [Linum trigynum]|uniref:Uncharacterized protein n=1 Tax=Linum trigynum TaxID=586398 RepID=A0AAV2EB14_9ROSI
MTLMTGDAVESNLHLLIDQVKWVDWNFPISNSFQFCPRNRHYKAYIVPVKASSQHLYPKGSSKKSSSHFLVHHGTEQSLQAQHVLRRTLSKLAPRKLAKVQGGDKAAKAGTDSAKAGTDSAEEEHEVEEEAWMKGKTAELAAVEISSLDKGKGVVEWSAKRKKSRSMDHVQEGLRLEKEGKSLIRDFTLVLKGNEASSSCKRVNRVLFVPSEDEEVDPSEYASSPEYTY